MLDIRHSEAAVSASVQKVETLVVSSSETAKQRIVTVSSITGLAAAIAQFQSDCATGGGLLSEQGSSAATTLRTFSRAAADLDAHLLGAL